MAIPIGSLGNRAGVAVLIVLAIGVRLAFALGFSHSMLQDPASDPDDYGRFAHTLATTGVFGSLPEQPSAYRPPLYSFLLAPWCLSQPPRVWGILLVQLVLSAGIVGFTWIIARQAGVTTFAWLAALIVAIDPLLIHQSTLIMSETLFTFLFCALLACWLRGVPALEDQPRRAKRPLLPRAGVLRDAAFRMQNRQSIPVSDLDRDSVAFYQSPPDDSLKRLTEGIAVGMILAAALLTRPVAGAFWALLVFPCILQRRFKEWLWVCLVAVLCCLPWIARNYKVYEEPVLLTTHGGYTLWLGQNPDYYEKVVAGRYLLWPESDFADWTQRNADRTRGMNELEKDRFFRTQAIKWMVGNPRAALETMVHHLAAFWSPIPRIGPVLLRRLCLIFYTAVFLLAILGLRTRLLWTTDLVALPAALIAFTLLHALYWSNIRMRTPVEPILAVLAAIALQRLFPDRKRASRNNRRPWR